MVKARYFIALAIVAVLAACGGGGGGGSSVPSGGVVSTPAPGTSAGVLPAGYLVTSVSITMARGTYAASTARRTQSVGTGTTSIKFTLEQQDGVAATSTPQTFGLTSSSPGCIQNQAQALVCTLGVDAPVGQDIFLAQTYDANGNLTGSGAVALNVALNSANAAAITLSAQVASVYVVTGATYLGNYYGGQSKARKGGAATTRRAAPSATRHAMVNIGSTLTSIPVYVIASDSSNNTILNPSNYNAPIYLQMAFDPYDYGLYYTPDVELDVTYGASDTSPCTANGTAAATGWYGSVMLCSPSDVVTAKIAANVGTNPSDEAIFFGWVNSSMLAPTPVPSGEPAPLPTPSTNSYAYIYISIPSTPTPSPSPSGSVAPITVIGS